MVFKETILFNVDRSGSRKIKIFHNYKRFYRQFSRTGDFVKSAVRTVERWPRKIRGKRYRPTHVGFVLRNLIVLTSLNKKLGNLNKVISSDNSAITLKKRGVLKSPHILSPTARPIRVKKYFYIFNNVL